MDTVEKINRKINKQAEKENWEVLFAFTQGNDQG